MADGYKKVIALTVIHRTLEPGVPGDKSKGVKPTKPKIQVIQPKTVFLTKDEAEFKELLAAKAIREPKQGEKVEVDIENAAATGEPVGAIPPDDYDKKSVAELKKIADSRDPKVEYTATATKADLIAAIRASELV